MILEQQFFHLKVFIKFFFLVQISDNIFSIFNFLGRLYQVEYAMEAIQHAGTCLGILASDGIVLAAEKRNPNKLLDDVITSEKIYKLYE